MAGVSLSTLLAQVRQNESRGNYSANATGGNIARAGQPASHASGAYQYQPGTWRAEATAAGYGGYAALPAGQAPPEVQDAVAGYSATHHDPNSTYLWRESAPSGGYPSIDASATGGGGSVDFTVASPTATFAPSFDPSQFGDNGQGGITVPQGADPNNVSPAGSGAIANPNWLTNAGRVFNPSDPANIFTGDPFGFGFTDSGAAQFGLPPGSVGNALGGALTGTGTNSTENKWWQNLLINVTDLSLRGGLGLLALVLIAAAAFAFAFAHGGPTQAARVVANRFIK